MSPCLYIGEGMRLRFVATVWVLLASVLLCVTELGLAAEPQIPLQKQLKEVTTDKKGEVERARIAKIIPPESESVPLTPAEIPAVYQDNARKKLAQRKYRVMTEVVETLGPPQGKGRKKRGRQKVAAKPTRLVPIKVFTSSYYDPRRPEDVIVKLPRR
jgi:hypothetical protein